MAFENITEKQLRGIDLTIKAVSKKFPFVQGWEFAKDYQNYNSTLFINLIVDFEKVGEFYGYEMIPYYAKKISTDPDLFISSFFGSFFQEGYKYDSPEYHEYIHRWWLKAQDVKEYLDHMYKTLPEDFQIFWSSERFPEYKHPIGLNLENFKQKK